MNKKIRILFTIPNFKTAGSQYVLLSILRSLDTEKYEAYVCVEKFPECFPDDIPKNRRVSCLQSGSLITDIKSFRNILKKHQIDLVHSWDYKSNFVEAIACRLSRVSYVFTKKNNAWSKRWLLKSVLANHIAYDNPEMNQRFFNTFYFKSKITFIPHGVDLKKFMPLPKLAHNTFNLCCVGNINNNKNQEFIIKALTSLPETVHLNLYGNAEVSYRNELRSYIKQHNLGERVHFHGYAHNTELPEIYCKQDVFVLASKNEGFPVCLLEAMACGIPVLSSNSGGGAAHLLEDNNGGYVFSINDANDLKNKIVLLMTNSEAYEKNKIAALQNVRSRFSLTNEIKAYDSLYLKITKNNNSEF